MFKYKIWDKQTSINGASAKKILESCEEYQDSEVFLIYDENKPHRIAYIQTSNDDFYEEGDTPDMTGQRIVKFYNEPPKSPTIESANFSVEQMEIVNKMIKDAVVKAVGQSIDELVVQVQDAVLDTIVPIQ